MTSMNFKVADSIAVDDSDFATGTLTNIELNPYPNDETGELTDQLKIQFSTKTRKGKDTKINDWLGLNISPIGKKVNNKTVYNALTQILIITGTITVADLKKLAKDENYLEEMTIDIESLLGREFKFKLRTTNKGFSKPDYSTLREIKPISLTVTK
jgi:hypothetical protein